MRVPPGYTMGAVLVPGPTVFVWEATGPGGAPCIVKSAVHDGAIGGLGREASILRALARVRFEGVPRVVGDGGRWIAVERLAGTPLAQLAGRLDAAPERASLVARAFARLADLHAARDEVGPLEVVHGDVSPGNVLASGGDGARDVAIIDFGLARWRGGEPPLDGALRGTLQTMAPEVARSQRATARSDDFALAASLLQILTGVPLRSEARARAALLAEAAESPFDASHPWAARARAPPGRDGRRGPRVPRVPAARPPRGDADLLPLISAATSRRT